MENTSAQPAKAAVPSTTTPVSTAPAVPHVDPKADLKIETAAPAPEEKKVSYGEKTFLIGIIFSIVILISVISIVLFWMQNTNQIQKTVTIEVKK